jgi:hypothetical protein
VAPAGGQVEVAGGTWRARWSLFRLLTGLDSGELALDTRIPEVQATLHVLTTDTSFERGLENQRYLDAAKWLSTRGPSQKVRLDLDAKGALLHAELRDYDWKQDRL